jgi:leucyl/phenylalanyl-tRNA--protein transferase
MPVFRLTKSLVFPSPEYADPDGLLAIGGDLSEQRLLLAYRMGIFPWYSKGMPILWWSPNPRLVLFPDELKVSHSLRRVIKKQSFHVTFDRNFREVMEQCALVRLEKGEDTWILPEMTKAYCRLHELGYCHSVESWHEGELVGGLYGMALGGVFFGESMFARKTDASKAAFVHLVKLLRRLSFRLIDCQVATAHLQSLGAREIERQKFLVHLAKALEEPIHSGSWSPFTTER